MECSKLNMNLGIILLAGIQSLNCCICFNCSYRPRDPKMNSEPIKFKAGANQVYVNTEHVVKPFKYTEADLQFDFEKDVYPVVIHCVALEGDGELSLWRKIVYRAMIFNFFSFF